MYIDDDDADKETVSMKTTSAFSLFISEIPDITMNSLNTISSDVSMNSLKQMSPGFGVIGDDFMQTLISFELFASDITDCKEKQFSYCFSGQTLRQAFEMVMDKQEQILSEYKYFIVNIGAIDILLERDLVDIETDFARLIQLMFGIGLQPIVTTIPHVLVNNNHPNEKIIRQTLMLFNNFLMNTYGYGSYLFVDLYASLFNGTVDDRNKNYHKKAKVLSVNKKILEIWSWNTRGRKKVVEAIDSFIIRKQTE